MKIEIFLFVMIVSFLAFLSVKAPRMKRVKTIGTESGYTFVKLPNLILAFLVFAAFTVISGYRGFAFADTGSYTYTYVNYLPSGFFEAWNNSVDDSPGFWAIAGLIKQLSNADAQIMLLVFAAVTIFLYIRVFYKYSERFDITVFLFITLGSFVVTMNAMRQCLASAIIFSGYKFLLNKKWFPFFILVGIAYFFHPTALIMIPVYIFCHRKPWAPLLTAALVVIMMVFTFVPSATNLIFGAMGDLKYSMYDTMEGANIGRGITMLVICYLAFRNRERLHDMFPHSDCLVNILIFHTLMLFAATSSWVFARLCIYTDVFVMMLIPMIIYASFKAQNRTISTVALVLFFLAYNMYEYGDLIYYSTVLGIYL